MYRKTLAVVLTTVLALLAGCGDMETETIACDHYRRFESLCAQHRFLEAAIEYEYGSNLVSYAYLRNASAGEVHAAFPTDPLLKPLSDPARIETLVELVNWEPYLPRLGPELQRQLAAMLGKSMATSAPDLTDYYRSNASRLTWRNGVFVYATTHASGRLPAGFEPISSAGTAADGYPLRVRCVRDGAVMGYVPRGKLWRPSIDGGGKWVYLGAYYMDICEVTNTQYGVFTAATGVAPPKYVRYWKGGKKEVAGFDGPGLPVTCVSWESARDYAKWAGKELPTINEWLRAAVGDGNRRFPWGDDVPSDTQRKDSVVIGRPDPLDGGKPEPVGGRLTGASPFGMLDMMGNIREWVAELDLSLIHI